MSQNKPSRSKEKRRSERGAKAKRLGKAILGVDGRNYHLPTALEAAEDMIAECRGWRNLCRILWAEVEGSPEGSQTRQRNLESVLRLIFLGIKEAQPDTTADEFLSDEDIRRAQLDNLRDAAEGLGLNLDELLAAQGPDEEEGSPEESSQQEFDEGEHERETRQPEPEPGAEAEHDGDA